MRTGTSLRFVVATTNRSKLAEINAALGSRFELLGLPDDFSPPTETGSTFEENAKLKGFYAASRLNLPALADDTGLEVDALQGAPGVRSARYLGDDASYRSRIEALLSRLDGVEFSARRARFRTVAVAAFPKGSFLVAEGVLEGAIRNHPAGCGGFGYDSIFAPKGFGGRSLAELTFDETIQISHRAQAFSRLLDLLTGGFNN